MIKYRAKCYSADGTVKYLLDATTKGFFRHLSNRLEATIESAFIHLPDRADGKPEYILCLSSQVGCAYKCLMCKNAFESFYGCLTPKEINEQIRLVLSQDNNLEKITDKGSVEYAFMGTGEPLYGTNVIRAIQTHKAVVPDTRFALSTVGAEGAIAKLSRESLPYPVRLEISLHFSNDKLRSRWITQDAFSRKLPELNIRKTLKEAQKYHKKYPGKITLNYVLIDGVNNMDANISELSSLLKGRTDIFYVKVMQPNLTSSLVYSYKNPFSPKTYSPKEFRRKLVKAGIPATLFESKGTDIWAGCGMMAVRFDNKKGIFMPGNIPEADHSKLGF